MAYVTHYIRARHYSQIGANWMTRDPLWPGEMPYGYVSGRVMSAVDPSGEKPEPDPCGSFWKSSSGKANRIITTPCGKLSLPRALPWPLQSGDKGGIDCYHSLLFKKMTAKTVTACVTSALGDFAYYQGLTQANAWSKNPVAEYDKWVHCTLGCLANIKSGSCCSHYLAIWMEVKPPAQGKFRGNRDPLDIKATEMGSECAESWKDSLTASICKIILPKAQDFFAENVVIISMIIEYCLLRINPLSQGQVPCQDNMKNIRLFLCVFVFSIISGLLLSFPRGNITCMNHGVTFGDNIISSSNSNSLCTFLVDDRYRVECFYKSAQEEYLMKRSLSGSKRILSPDIVINGLISTDVAFDLREADKSNVIDFHIDPYVILIARLDGSKITNNEATEISEEISRNGLSSFTLPFIAMASLIVFVLTLMAILIWRMGSAYGNRVNAD